MNPIAQLAVLLTAIVGIGFALNLRWCQHPRITAWGLAIFGPTAAFLITKDQSPVLIMVALILALLFGMKAVVVVSDRHRATLNLPQWLAFAVAWLGMRPSVFKHMGDSPLPGALRLIGKGTSRFAIGLILFITAHLLWKSDVELAGPMHLMLVLGLLFPALSLILHFGLLNAMTGFWRWRGVPVANLFNAPYKAHTLGDFWGRRWNVAFAEMTAIGIYRPLRQRFGDGIARMGAFLFSGIAHELAISVPVQAGYGLPTLYFALQALGTHLERRFQIRGQLWTALWLLIPAPILFHTQFLVEIMLPVLEMKP